MNRRPLLPHRREPRVSSSGSLTIRLFRLIRLLSPPLPRKRQFWVDTPCHSHVKLWMLHEAVVIWGKWAMRQLLFGLGVVFFVTGSLNAQTSPANPLLLAAPFSMSSTGTVAATSTSSPSSTAYSLLPAFATSAALAAPATSPFTSAPAANLSADPQYVQGVFVNYNWQAYLGYTFFHFSGPHGISRNMNGFNYSIVYYFNSWFGLDGEMMATHDSPNGQSSWFLLGGGGPRVRWQAPKGIEVWAHAIIAFSHLTPQTAFGKQEALAYEVGGGADFNTPFRRIALRVGADMVGSQYYHDNQFNPKAFAGVVFKF